MATNDNQGGDRPETLKARLAERVGPSEATIRAHYGSKRGRAELKAAWDQALILNPEPLTRLLKQLKTAWSSFR